VQKRNGKGGEKLIKALILELFIPNINTGRSIPVTTIIHDWKYVFLQN